MRCLIGCEFSGIVRAAFAARGHSAFSCDLLPSESVQSNERGWHIQGNVLDILNDGWDFACFHPPCTFLTVSANKWMKPEFKHKFPDRPQQRQAAIAFFMALWNSPIAKVAIENPTCLWLRGLPLLQPTHRKNDLFALPEPEAREQRLHRLPPTPDRWKLRSLTYPRIAKAMAEQWNLD